MMKWLFLLRLLLFSSLLLSQSKVDSLLHSLKTLEDDSLKVQTYLRLTVQYIRIDQNMALEYANKAGELADRLGLEIGLAQAKYRKGTVYRSMNLNNEAAEQFIAAKSVYSKTGNNKEIASTLIELGLLAQLQSKNEEALTLYLEALTLVKEIGGKNSEARVYNYIGGIYGKQKQYNKAIENYGLALSLVKELGFKPGISACLTNLANVYTLIKQYDKALSHLKEALNLKKQIGDKLGASRVLGSLGSVYNRKQQYEIAEEHYLQAYDLAKEVGSSQGMANMEYGLANNAFHRNDFEQCIKIANNIITNLPSLKNIQLSIETHKLISRAYREKGILSKALDHADIHTILSDSLYNENILSVTNDLEAKYQNEQKVKEIALLESEKEIQTLQLNQRLNERNGIIVLAIVMFILAGLLYNQYRIKQKANNKLKELDRLKSNFFANISHEFRTPLTLIKGPIEQLEQNPNESLSVDSVKMIKRNINRILNLVSQLLDLSKIDEGNLQLESTEGDVYKCLRTAASSFNSHAAQRNIDYRVQIPQTVLWASFDRDKLEKVVYNLLSNAFKFSDSNSVISYEVEYGRQDLQMRVSDSGKGIPEEKLPFIFDRFYQVDSSSTKEQEGSGIGLSLSKDLVKLMDGTISVSSEMNKGTFFTVQLPIQEIKTGHKNSVKDVPKTEKSVPKKPFALSKEDKRNLPYILLVEDNTDMRHFIKETLIQEYKITEAINGKVGLRKAIADPPDLIITDLMMPKMDGLEFCKKLKTDVLTSHIPVIMLTAKAGMDNKIEGLERGADDYLTKPFDAKELLVRTKNLIEQRQNLRELFTRSEIKIDPKKVTVISVDQKFLEQVLALLETNYSNPEFGVPQMQVALAMSKTQLHRKLRALTNEAPGELLRNFRLKSAAQLLSQKEDSVTQIAYKVGFNNLSYFAKCFKELFGVAPSSY